MTDILQALSAVMNEVGYVQKTAKKGLSYTFAGEAALIKAIRPALVDHGIVVYPKEVKDLHLESYSTKSGTEMIRTVIVTTYTFAHAPSGTSIDVTVTGEGADVGDKSAAKAQTIAYKYALRQALLIETGDDPDEAAAVPAAAPPKQRTNQAKADFWHSLNDAERMAYSEPDDIVRAVYETIPRYGENYFAARGAIKKLFPEGWPEGRTFEDGSARVGIYRAVKAYAMLRNAGVDGDEALKEVTQ